jgi:DNA-directed RNA polymerase specialized sigma24 family protein
LDAREEVDWMAQNWKILMPQLEAFAIGRLKGTLPRVAEAKDLVQQAVAKTIGKERRWRSECCTLFQHLAGVIKNDISHATGSSESRLMVSDPGPANGETLWPPDVADESPNQEQREEWRSEERRLLEFLGRQDPMLERMARLIHFLDVRETEDLCRLLDLEPAEIANCRKRLKRALQAYAESWS